MKNNAAYALTPIVLLTLLVFGILHWTNLPIGDFSDWVIGIVAFWWLMLITTIPWNLHFKAKEILSDAQTSIEAGIAVKKEDIQYAKKISKTYLFVAISLHLFSGLGFYIIAWQGISNIGYIGAVLAVLLTVLRPAARMYEYLQYRLSRMSNRIKYPREDILEVRQKIAALTTNVNKLMDKLDEKKSDSWLNHQAAEAKVMQEDIRALRQQFEQLYTKMDVQHIGLVKQTENKIASLSEDAQFLNQVRQLIRFWKEA